jgi:dihydrofolate reductase
MGRKTYESLNRPLPGRTNIVVTRQTDYEASGCIIAQDFNSAIKSVAADESEAFIIGGGQLYHETIPLADRIYVTLIPREILGDTFFPEIPDADFEIKKSDYIDGPEPYHFYIYERVKS